MAKPKHQYKIEVYGDKIVPCIHLYTHDLRLDAMEIEDVEGVTMIIIVKSIGMMTIHTNPLYDINEIASEIEELITSTVPESFKD